MIHQLERQAAATAGLAQRCGIQAGQLSLLSGVADALTRKSDPDVALRDVLAATLDAAGISKGALILRDATGRLELRQDVGFSEAERSRLQHFFGHGALLEDIVNRGGSVSVPSPAIPDGASRDILAGANIAAAQIVPLISDGRGVGAMIIGGDEPGCDQRRLRRICAGDGESGRAIAGARAIGGASDRLGAAIPDLAGERQRLYRHTLPGRHRSGDESPVGGAHRASAGATDRTSRARVCAPVSRRTSTCRPTAKPSRRARFARRPSRSPDRMDPVRSSSSRPRTSMSAGERLVFTIGRDVTERLRAEEALEHSREDQLRLKDEFLSHVSHELRTPVTAIQQFTAILLDGMAGELTTEQREYQQIVLRNVQQLLSMIDELLEVTRLATGTVHYRAGTCVGVRRGNRHPRHPPGDRPLKRGHALVSTCHRTCRSPTRTGTVSGAS